MEVELSASAVSVPSGCDDDGLRVGEPDPHIAAVVHGEGDVVEVELSRLRLSVLRLK